MQTVLNRTLSAFYFQCHSHRKHFFCSDRCFRFNFIKDRSLRGCLFHDHTNIETNINRYFLPIRGHTIFNLLICFFCFLLYICLFMQHDSRNCLITTSRSHKIVRSISDVRALIPDSADTGNPQNISYQKTIRMKKTASCEGG